MVETLSALVLAFALYVTLKPVDELLARLAMYWRIGESFVGFVGVIGGFFRLRLYSAPHLGEELLAVARQAGFVTTNISALCFSIGSGLFFYLFYKSRYIPRLLAAVGVFASVVVILMCFGSLIYPEHSGTMQYGWAPMAIAEVGTGVWLMVFGVREGRAAADAARG